MGNYQRQKGARGELLWRDECHKAGFQNVQRGCQLYQTGAEIADCIGLDGIHQEIKFQERLNLRAAVEQSQRDAVAAGLQEIPIVAHKTSRKPWLVTMIADDWFSLYRAWRNEQNDKGRNGNPYQL